MLSSTARCIRGAAAAIILICGNAQAQIPGQDELEVAGVSVYTETARDIYMAGLYLPPGSPLENLLLSPPPKAMEYRFATRRLSSRGFSGMLLLQAELGSGERASDAALGALNVVKRNLKGSLKQGDRFVILLDEQENTVFLLNGVEIYRAKDGTVFDFLFAGWVGDTAAATFREPLLAGRVKPALSERFDGLGPSEQRIATINGWVAPDAAPAATPTRVASAPAAPAPAQATAGTTVAAAAPAAAAPAASAVVEATETVASAADTAASAVVEVAAEPETIASNASEQAAPAAEAPAVQEVAPIPEPAEQQVAGTTAEQAPKPEPVQEVAAALPVEGSLNIDDREYQRQLQEYVSKVMHLVYGEVKYPRRAIKYEWEGRVELSARLDDTGGLLDVVVDSSSGHSGLDKAAEAAIKRAAPFPELTPVAREELSADEGDGYVMSIPITFALRR